MGAKRDDWKITPMPAARATLAIDRTYTAAEFAKIRDGSIPEAMEDKWFAFYEEPWLHLHRSWTGYGVYEVRFELADGHGQFVEAMVSRDHNEWGGTDDTSDALLLVVLLDGYAGRDTRAAWERYTEWQRQLRDDNLAT